MRGGCLFEKSDFKIVIMTKRSTLNLIWILWLLQISDILGWDRSVEYLQFFGVVAEVCGDRWRTRVERSLHSIHDANPVPIMSWNCAFNKDELSEWIDL